MNLSSNSQFGLIVAYLLPGFIGLTGIAPFAPVVAAWLRPSTYAEASLGPPVYALLAATTIGMIASSIRWLVIDQLHHAMGLNPPLLDDARLEERLTAFNYLVENHYRYYQFVANTLVAVAGAYAINRWAGTSHLFGVSTDIGVVVLCGTLFVASRDNLAKYYSRTGRLVGQVLTERKTDVMTNGNDHGGGASSHTSSQTKPAAKPQPSPKSDQKTTESKQRQK